MHSILTDLKVAFRRLRKRPWFTLAAIASLGIGIGANTAIFSLVNAILLRPLPLERPQELVEVYRSVAGFSHATFSYPGAEDLRRETAEVFTDVTVSRLALVQLDAEDGPEVVPAELVSGGHFALLGVPPLLGRNLSVEDHVSPGGHPVVTLSYGFWQRRFGGAEDVVGRELRLNGRPYTVVGVVPKAYTGNMRGIMPDLYAPVMMVNHLQPGGRDELVERGNQSMFAKARLLPASRWRRRRPSAIASPRASGAIIRTSGPEPIRSPSCRRRR